MFSNKSESNIYRLSRQGYSILKNDENKNILDECKKELTVKPNINSDYGGQAKSFPVYRESINRLYMPRHYGTKKIGNPDKIIFEKSDDIDLKFNGKLRELQENVVDKFVHEAKTNGGGLICLGCGQGKTVIAINRASKLKKKTIVVVHKEFLVNQWIERIKQFLPDARIGKIQGPKFDIENKDIVIAMLQTLSQKNFEKGAFDSFGLAVCDEAHHLSAEVFSRALPKIACEYTLGLSATPKRKDGLSKVFEWYLGPIVYKQKKKDKDDVNINIINFSCNDPQYGIEITNYMGKVNIPTMITYIADLPIRNNRIINEIKNIMLEPKRKIIVLSDRRSQLNTIKNAIEENNICSVGLYVGGMKQEQLDISEKKDLILSTFNMASEAMDIPLLNTLILATSKSDIEQSVGRILRQKKEDRAVTPLIVDIVDNYSIFARQAIKRKKFFEKNDYIFLNSEDNCNFSNKTQDDLFNTDECLID